MTDMVAHRLWCTRPQSSPSECTDAVRCCKQMCVHKQLLLWAILSYLYYLLPNFLLGFIIIIFCILCFVFWPHLNFLTSAIYFYVDGSCVYSFYNLLLNYALFKTLIFDAGLSLYSLCWKKYFYNCHQYLFWFFQCVSFLLLRVIKFKIKNN